MGHLDPTWWLDRRVMVTGHSGFKGAWLCVFLEHLGASVSGFSDHVPEGPLYTSVRSMGSVRHYDGDVRDSVGVAEAVHAERPELIFHMAAQPLVRQSYDEPAATWATNVMGTVAVLEVVRQCDWNVAVVVITTDKVYHNVESVHGYRETDRLGGSDPYSSSKAAAELAVESWRTSFDGVSERLALATARAGNVIGGGDLADDRIVADIFRAAASDESLVIRNPGAVRPWQHVLEPLNGYLELGWRLRSAQVSDDVSTLQLLCSAWNFGPPPSSTRTVGELVVRAREHWPTLQVDSQSPREGPHETSTLKLSIDKALTYLDWRPHLSFDDTIRLTIEFYRAVDEGAIAFELAKQQLTTFLDGVLRGSGSRK